MSTEAPRAKVEGRASWPAGLEWLRPGVKRGNSNSWVVAGRRTKGGRALLANDPHLPIEFPSVWYELHLVAAGLDVAGVTIPGVPFVVLGHNAGSDGASPTLAPTSRTCFSSASMWAASARVRRGEWVPVEVTPADIPVRGQAQPYRFEVWKTRNGPIFADVGLDWDAPPSWLSPTGRLGGRAPRLFHSMGCWWRPRGLVRGHQSGGGLDLVHCRGRVVRPAFVEPCLRRRRRQYRLRHVGPLAGASGRRWRHARRWRQRRRGVERGGSAGNVAACDQSAGRLHRDGQQRDRPPISGADHQGLGGAVPRHAAGPAAIGA